MDYFDSLQGIMGLELLAPFFFGVVQIFSLVLAIVIRYHFRHFSFAHDQRAKVISNVFLAGVIAFFAGSLILLIPFLL
jgi:hypothetical protein